MIVILLENGKPSSHRRIRDMALAKNIFGFAGVSMPYIRGKNNPDLNITSINNLIVIPQITVCQKTRNAPLLDC
jgi:hypothetical protein